VRDSSPELKIPLIHTTYEDGAEYSEMLAHTIQKLGNHPKERIQQNLKCFLFFRLNYLFITRQLV
jgi:hypothetical protein